MSISSINNRVFSRSTIESLSKIDKNKDKNISVGELKNLVTDQKGNIDYNKLKSIGITDQKDIKIIRYEYKNHKSEPKEIIFQINNKASEKNLKIHTNVINSVKLSPLDILKEKKKLSLIEQKTNLEIFSGKTSKNIFLPKDLEIKKYMSVINKFKAHNIQPLSAPTTEIYSYSASSGSPRSSNDIKNLYISKMTSVIQTNGKSINDNFRDNIINYKKENMDISDVLKASLKTTSGDYSLAVATVSNTFKSASYELRDLRDLPKNQS